jgi:hypothetical protein
VALILWSVACALVLGSIIALALRRPVKMPEWMEVADEQHRIQFQSRIIHQRPASERFGDTGGQL